MSNLLRSCGGCSAFLLTNDPSSQTVWCKKCKPKYVAPFDDWAARLSKGDRVFVQPYTAWRGLSRSENVVIDRDGDNITVQIIGIPESRQVVHVTDLGQHNLTPRSRTGALD
jgi:hypothetical protein